MKNPSIWKESLTWIVPRDALCTRREFGRGDVLIADLEELETMDASEIYSKRLNAKEVIFPKQGEFIFPIADGRIKPIGGDQDLRNIHLGYGIDQFEEKVILTFLETQKGLFHHLKTHFRIAVKR